MSDPAQLPPAPALDRRDLALRAVALVGIAFSVMLLVDYVHTPVFCGGAQSGCDAVRRSAWARPLGIPLPILGTAFFTTLLAVTSVAGPARRALGPLGVVSALSGVGLIAIQAGFIHHFCKLCLVVDASALTAGALALAIARDREALPAPRLALPTAGLAVAALAIPLAIGLSHQPPQPPANVPVIEPMPELVARAQVPGKATIVEFVDYECPFCRRQQESLAPVLASYGDRVRLIRKNVPLSFHEHARGAARAACCAEEQGRGEPMSERLFRAEDLTPEGCERIAQELHLDLAAYRSCLASRRPDVVLERDHDDARAARVSGLPTLWIGREKFEGFTSPEALRASIDRALAASSTAAPRSGT
jgi:protein-disulfide isomerase